MKFDGERLEEKRKDKGLTQKKFGEKLGVSDKAISAYENGHAMPTPDKLPLIAKELDISLDYLFGLTDYDIPLSHKKYIILSNRWPDKLEDDLLEHLKLLKLKYNVK